MRVGPPPFLQVHLSQKQKAGWARLARRLSGALSGGVLILALGVTVLLLADLLKAIYESNLTGS